MARYHKSFFINSTNINGSVRNRYHRSLTSQNSTNNTNNTQHISGNCAKEMNTKIKKLIAIIQKSKMVNQPSSKTMHVILLNQNIY